MKKATFLVLAALLPLVVKSPEHAIALDTEVKVATTTEVFSATKAEVKEVEVPLTNRQIVEGLAEKYAAEYGVSKDSLFRTLSNENNTFEFCRQSEMTYKPGNRWGQPAGSYELSFGVAQIHLPDHPNITKAQACDPDFAVRFMAENFSKGRQGMWMGYVG